MTRNHLSSPSTVPDLVAHRGYAARYPENTLLALREAVAAGARYIEFDVQLCADAVPVLLHDADLQRTAGEGGSVFELTAAELTKKSVGEPERFGHRFAEERVPTLAAIVDWLASVPQVTAFVEIKTESIRRFGAETVHNAVWAVLEPVRAQCVLISYDDAFLFAARLAGPMRIGWVVAEWDDAHARRVRALAPDYLFCNWKRLPPAPQMLWQGGWRWGVYEVVDPGQALALAARGVDLVETMAIGEMLADPRLAAGDV